MTAGVERVEANLTLPSQVVGQEVEGSATGLPAGYEDILSRLANYCTELLLSH